MESKVRHGAGASRVNDNRFDVASNYTLRCLSFIGNWVDAALIVSFMCHIHVSNQGEVVKAIACSDSPIRKVLILHLHLQDSKVSPSTSKAMKGEQWLVSKM
jgi:hypothetical protein